MDPQLLGKCGFYCGSCPTNLSGQCPGCIQAHDTGDCFTRDCVLEKGLCFCGQCRQFPCDTILTRPKSTVLDREWLLWKRQVPSFDLDAYWHCVLHQDADALSGFFTDDAVIRWHNTDEQFSVSQFVRANCEYPGKWQGQIQRRENCGNEMITVVRVWSDTVSFHVTSFFAMNGSKIQTLDEYWGDDAPAPQWRRAMQIGCPIGLEFYPAAVEDTQTWGRLRRAAWDATYRGIYPDGMIDQFDFSWHLQKDTAKLLSPEYHVFFVRLHGKDVGYLAFRHHGSGVTLNSLYLLPEAQHRGIGRIALERVGSYCREQCLSTFRLQCNPWNQNAMGFYKAMGGTIIQQDCGHAEKLHDGVWFEFAV